MAKIETYKIPQQSTPKRAANITPIMHSFSLSAGNSGDDIVLFDMPAQHVVADCWLRVEGTLGAGCTLQLRQGTSALTAATTAAAAGIVRMESPQNPTTAQTEVNLLIGGANVGTAAVVRVMVAIDPQQKLHG